MMFLNLLNNYVKQEKKTRAALRSNCPQKQVNMGVNAEDWTVKEVNVPENPYICVGPV